MTRNVIRHAILLATVVASGAFFPLFAQEFEPLAANDNRTPAGELRDGVLTLHLEMRKGVWHPESEKGETIPVYAFAETGKGLQVPGPTIRVPEGTTIDISLRNKLTVEATIRGLHQHPGDNEYVITVAPGATVNARFVVGAPGTYLYWARTPDGPRGNGRVLDALLGGAFVVDPPGASTDDRIFVFERWNGATRTAINGKSWPYTERLNYKVGERVRWRFINASDLSHPMHLHGSYFTLEAEGDGERYSTNKPGEQPVVFTHSVQIGETFDMSWVPSEPGRWLYHCHRIPHMRLPVALDPADVLVADDHEHVHDAESDYAGMGGMILGITVTGPSKLDTSTNWKPQRRLELTVGERNGDPRFFQLSLRDLAPAAAQARPQVGAGLSGPLIVLNQDEPVEIVIVNKLKEPTAVHWHGMELESYYDGVPTWGGIGPKKTPPIDPGQTFTVRMMAPHAGTFMYHTHWHDQAQLNGGILGPVIVMPPGQKYDPTSDRPFIYSQGPNEPYGNATLLANGTPQPNAMQLKVGTTYRFRFMNITPALDNLRISLRQSGSPVQWRLVAKDSVDVPHASMMLADQEVAIGETFDFEYTATSPGQLTLEGIQPNDTRRTVQTLIFTAP
jgi:manganese oxidase